MAAPNVIRRAAMIPSRTTFHMAVGGSTYVMQRRMVAVLATRQFSSGAGPPASGTSDGIAGGAPRTPVGPTRWPGTCPNEPAGWLLQGGGPYASLTESFHWFTVIWFGGRRQGETGRHLVKPAQQERRDSMRRVRSMLAVVGLFAAGIAPLASGGTPLVARAAPSTQHLAINCEYSRICPDVANSADVFGTDKYVGHDEPSDLFYSSLPGSGNRLSYDVTLPTDPSATNPGAPGKSFQFQLNGALWFGMALCDTQSYPEQVSTCPADSDSNIANNPDRNAPDFIGHHSGTAFVELQFYPPGWVPWPTWAVAVGASACDATKWCAAMNIFNLLEDPINGTTQNATCASRIGLETVNFAFVTRNGRTQAPPNPVDSTLATFTPDPQRDLFMNSGDHLNVSLRDTASGLRAVVNDLSTGQSGSMTASASNGIAQIQYDPTGTSCNAIPFTSHPMYRRSSERTRGIWTAHTYNVAFSG